MTETNGGTLLIRADVGVRVGCGHVMRCLALAQAWQDTGGHAIFVMATQAPALATRLCAEGMGLVRLVTQLGNTDDAIQTANLARQVGADWVVVDGYHFGAGYQRVIKDASLRLLVIDDYGHANYYWADYVLNQNIYAQEGFYATRAPYAQLLLGSRYVLLRREFLRWRGWRRAISETSRRVLITLGGSDPDNMTLQVINALRQVRLDGLQVVAVVGESNPHYDEVQSTAIASRLCIRIEKGAKSMPDLMRWADIAIAGAGSTSWELVFMGLPAITVVLAANQHAIADALNRAGLVLDVGPHDKLSSDAMAQAVTQLLTQIEMRREMARRGRGVVDGEGARRVAARLGTSKVFRASGAQETCDL